MNKLFTRLLLIVPLLGFSSASFSVPVPPQPDKQIKAQQLAEKIRVKRLAEWHKKNQQAQKSTNKPVVKKLTDEQIRAMRLAEWNKKHAAENLPVPKIMQTAVFRHVGLYGENYYWLTDFTANGTKLLESDDKENKHFLVTNISDDKKELFYNDFYYVFHAFSRSIYKTNGIQKDTQFYGSTLEGAIDKLTVYQNKVCYFESSYLYCIKDKKSFLVDGVTKPPSQLKTVPKAIKDKAISYLLYKNSYYFVDKQGFLFKADNKQKGIKKILTKAIVFKNNPNSVPIKLIKIVNGKLIYSKTEVLKETGCRSEGSIKSTLYFLDLKTQKHKKLNETEVTIPLHLC